MPARKDLPAARCLAYSAPFRAKLCDMAETYELLRMNLLMLAVTASPVNELATILFCGTTDQPTPICCQAARDVRNQTDKRGRAIIDRYLARNCDKEKDRRP